MIKYETNSKLIQPGQIFIAIKGHTVDGHDFIESAIKNGAVEIVAEREVNVSVPLTVVSDTKEYVKDRMQEEYASELENIKFIGVTGTNGKTTTCYLAYQLLQKLGVNVAYIGTIGFYYNDEFRELENTTPDILELYKLLLEAKEKGAEYIIMEVSSHALSYKRIAGLKYEIGAFTNLTQDHLDFHGDMENYLNEKLKLIDYLKPNSKMIVNSDDIRSINFIEKASSSATIGINGDYKILKFDVIGHNTEIRFSYNNKEYDVKTNLIGAFNVYNYMIALGIVNNLNFSIEDIIKVTKDIYAPKGRVETIAVGNAIAIVDFAHTPDAVENIIDECKKFAKGRIITTIGCGGDRDRKKRPIMGRLALTKSDYVIFTNDNPRTEDEKQIMDDIIRSNEEFTHYEIIHNRAQAITKGLDMLKENDILLILGKGHENYQIIGTTKNHFDDSEEVKKYLMNK